MFHANGWTFTWTVTAAGAAHICLRRVDAASIYEHVNRERVSHLCAAPTVLIAIANGPEDQRAGLRRGLKVFTAGAPPAAATIERLETELGWDVTHVYGLTETAPFISICEPLPEHAELCGADRATLKARQGVELVTSGELRVVDESMQDVPRDGATLGEIIARGNVVMRGYYNDLDATAAAFRGGWFHSGDAAVVHPDGYVEIRDRFKDVIISGGENISSIEVEGALLRHCAILETAVVGMPHEKWGETPHAFVVLRPGASATEAELSDFARGTLAHFKSRYRRLFISWPNCRRPPPGRFRNSYCAGGPRRSFGNDRRGGAPQCPPGLAAFRWPGRSSPRFTTTTSWRQSSTKWRARSSPMRFATTAFSGPSRAASSF